MANYWRESMKWAAAHWQGDVVTAAVILDPLQPIEGLGDSKKISEKRREQLYEEITASKLWLGA